MKLRELAGVAREMPTDYGRIWCFFKMCCFNILFFYFFNILKYRLAEKSDSFISETKKMDFEKNCSKRKSLPEWCCAEIRTCGCGVVKRVRGSWS